MGLLFIKKRYETEMLFWMLLTGSGIYNDHWNNAINDADKGVVINFVDNRNGADKMEYL